MQSRAIHFYVGLMCGLALFCLAILDWSAIYSLEREYLIGLAAVIALGLLSESMALQIKIEKSSSNSSITLLPLIASVLLFGPEAAVIFFIVIGVVVEIIVRKKRLIKAAFNISQYVFSAFLSGVIFLTAGGVPYVQYAGDTGGGFDLNFGPFVLFAVSFLILNHGFVSLAIALSEGVALSKVWTQAVGRSGSNMLYDLLISPIAIAVAYLYVALGIMGLLLILLPLEFIRHSYLTTFKLQQANRDLLTALVKAIETRDPYTSGHSLRVSRLAVRIASIYGLNKRIIAEVETAAILHDIGKIEAIYTEILEKPGSLTEDERKVIESHVTKGVDLLKSLASFSERVILAVKYHHERMDGKGYPDGLSGEEIPIGAKIIKVCDAIDAMLSDRPYRDALDIGEVRNQLEMFSGIQFDGSIVKCIDDKLLEEHRRDVQKDKGREFVFSTLTSLEAGRDLTTRKLGIVD